MANLLSQEYKKKVQREYHLRLAVIVSVMSACVLAIGTTLLISPYMLLTAKYEVLESIASREGEVRADELQQAKDVLGDLQKKIARASVVINSRSVPNSVISDILELSPDSVSLTRISYDSSVGDGQVVLSGVAKDRAGLRTFVEGLKQDPHFKEVVDPKTNYISQEDLDYTLTLLLVKPS